MAVIGVELVWSQERLLAEIDVARAAVASTPDACDLLGAV
jgi:hypothetical protein